jgi:hypothetical protein
MRNFWVGVVSVAVGFARLIKNQSVEIRKGDTDSTVIS